MGHRMADHEGADDFSAHRVDAPLVVDVARQVTAASAAVTMPLYDVETVRPVLPVRRKRACLRASPLAGARARCGETAQLPFSARHPAPMPVAPAPEPAPPEVAGPEEEAGASRPPPICCNYRSMWGDTERTIFFGKSLYARNHFALEILILNEIKIKYLQLI